MQNQSDKYLEMKIQTATPEALVGILYEGAIRFLKQATRGMDGQDWYVAHSNIVRAQNIISELNVTLDKEKGGDIASNLSKIYTYIHDRLIEANIKKDPNLVGECIGLLSELNSAWSKVIKDARGMSTSREGVVLAG